VIGIISEVMPIPGALAAALVFPEGIHSDHPIGYLVLALLTNLLLFTFLAYFVMAVIVQIRSSTR
jgi:hypothetical protein